MIEMYHIAREYGSPVRWLTRALSIVISCVFLLILFLAVTNEDMPHGAAIPVLVLLALTIVSSMAAWRWEKAGGFAVIFLALCLSAAAYSSSRAFGLRSLSFIPAVIYGVPFLVVGTLFWVCGQMGASGSQPDLAAPARVLCRWWFIGAVLATVVALTVMVASLLTGARVGG